MGTIDLKGRLEVSGTSIVVPMVDNARRPLISESQMERLLAAVRVALPTILCGYTKTEIRDGALVVSGFSDRVAETVRVQIARALTAFLGKPVRLSISRNS